MYVSTTWCECIPPKLVNVYMRGPIKTFIVISGLYMYVGTCYEREQTQGMWGQEVSTARGEPECCIAFHA